MIFAVDRHQSTLLAEISKVCNIPVDPDFSLVSQLVAKISVEPSLSCRWKMAPANTMSRLLKTKKKKKKSGDKGDQSTHC